MKKLLLSAVLCCGFITTTFATSTDTLRTQMRSTGDLYQGMSRAIPNGRMVVPYGLEVTFDKTTHLIFPAAICYVDLGSNNLIAGKAEGAENVLRVKAAVRDFETETNLSVICDDGSLYSFNVKYADEPEKLSVEMADFLSQSDGRLPANRADIYFKELGRESPMLVKLLMKTIKQSNRRTIRHIGARQFGIEFLLRGLYVHNNLLYFHLSVKNETYLPYPIDQIAFRIVDKKVVKRTAIQERVLQPLRAYNQPMRVRGNGSERMVFAFEGFSLPDDKQLEVTIHERNGGRTLSFRVQNEDLLRARRIDHLKLQWR